MRAVVPWLLTVALLGCAKQAIVRESAVAVRPRQGDDDSGLALSFAATLCSVTLRDESGRLHDREAGRDDAPPLEMTRAVLDRPWHVTTTGYASSVLTVLALPPGRYTLTRYQTSDDFEDVEPDADGARASTDCSATTSHPARVPIRIERGQLTLLELPRGLVDFQALRMMASAVQSPDARQIGSWLPAVRRAGAAMHRELAEKQRQRRDGYDVYPNCDGKVAVVRATGTPFNWYARPDDEAARRSFRHQAAVGASSVHATGFGAGCVKELAFVYLLSDPRELDGLARAVGERLAAENLAGEIDLVLSGRPELVGAGAPATP